jgi:SAM-dependent methyltransferase
MTAVSGRAERERAAYDEGDVWEHSHRWHRRFPHVFTCPNTLRHERLFAELLRTAVRGKRVLELGCGDGENASRLLGMGAEYVLGVDVSETFLDEARRRAQPGRLEFSNRDAGQPFETEFDAVVGRSILHHLDYRPLLQRLHAHTLRADGMMVFMEPLGSHPLIRLYTQLVPNAHTPDERSLRLDDLRWLRREFTMEFHPFNLVSLPAGLVSSYLFSSPDNLLTRLADRVDTWLAHRSLWLDSHFRHSVLVIHKSAGARGPKVTA